MGEIDYDINAKCQYFVTPVLNHDFVDESRGAVLMSCDVNLRCTMCGEMTHDINAKSQHSITHVLKTVVLRRVVKSVLMHCEVRCELNCAMTILVT